MAYSPFIFIDKGSVSIVSKDDMITLVIDVEVTKYVLQLELWLFLFLLFSASTTASSS